ncbi:peptidase M56 BlaR1 [Gemmatirosa kalamazoonensis]|uniref:Peptidase M56 BlaR1 n=1 Tax=Gemmatirosa kalamazoonensis TaxID=861299 RepID=W0RFD9_9BACT|nr:M56 family metallopeptidase [Gemmatirosa kalamazoonensis]AHG89511.1 peptidase M56 BlaR1 [Gemmatirosa kalamazoonensis]
MSTLAIEIVAKATLLLALAGLIAASLRSATAATRHALWAVALGALLVLPATIALGPRWRVPVLAVRDTSSAHGTARPPLPRAVVAPLPAALVGDDAGPPARLKTRGADSPSAPQPIDLATLAAAIWAAGAVALLLRLVAGHVALGRLARRAERIDDAWGELLDDECARAGVRAPVRLLLHEGAASPATWGVRAPVIVLPASAADWAEPRRRTALRHELAHVARRDALVQLVSSAACALYWFHPGAWLAARRLVAERERACDDRVLALGSAPAEYASQLLDMARLARDSGLPALVTVSMARRSELEGRLLDVLDPRRARGRPSRAAGAAGVLLACALVVGLSAFRAVPRAASPSTVVPRTPVEPLRAALVPDVGALAPVVHTRQRDDSTFERALPASRGGTLTLDLRTGGAVDITGTDDDRVTVRGTLAGRAWRSTRVSLEPLLGGGVRLRAVYDGTERIQSSSHRFVIRVPRRYDVQLSSAGGSVTVRDLEGTLTGSTGGGEIEIQRVTGHAQLSTGGGDVHVSDARLTGRVATGGGEVLIERVVGGLTGHSGTGDVTYAGRGTSVSIEPSYEDVVRSRSTTTYLDARRKLADVDTVRGVEGGAIRRRSSGGAIAIEEAPRGAVLYTGGGSITVGRSAGLVSATTGGGEISLGPVDGSAEGHTGAGDVTIVVVGDGAARHDVYVTTGYGAADVWLPADISARLDLETAYTNNLGHATHIYSDWPIDLRETADWDAREGTPRRYVRGSATLGDGRSEVRVRIVNGDVRLHRGSPPGR